MPPRKRAETKPDPETPETSETPELEEPEVEPDAETGGGGAPDEAPAKSDLQAVEQPCAQCFPNGWPELGYAVGCEHGVWTRAKA